MRTEATQGLYQRLQKLTGEATAEQLVYLTKSLELLKNKEDEEKATADALNEIKTVTKRSVDSVNDLKAEIMSSLKKMEEEQRLSFEESMEKLRSTVSNANYAASANSNFSNLFIPEAIPYLTIARGFDRSYYNHDKLWSFSHISILNADRLSDPAIAYSEVYSMKYMRCKPFSIVYNRARVIDISHQFALIMFLRNTTSGDIATQIITEHYGDNKPAQENLMIGTPNSTNSERDKINSMKWDNIIKLEGTEKSHQNKYNITIPADKTVAFMVSVCSSYGEGLGIIINSQDKFLEDGLEIDKERTIKALQLPRTGAP